ncbi:uncharacterized protein LOC112552579 [Pogonomyrmex barbatus]|uniref:Uncharacterized protein LOC112552579 n=1 Tax=Pogonomyrmex barbatus TaxID=144034 RepID=A0A8N1S5D5_9HYME|nr:uncharacterized protein LOC112552579 [Pogonomyrmex barbatus]
MFFLMIVAGMMCTAINYFRIFQIVSFGFDTEKFLSSIVFAQTYVLYLCIGCHIGQQIIDHNKLVFETVYNVQWYIAPLQIQKMILFLLQRGSKTFTLNIAGLFIDSLEGAATLMKAILSYFTFLHSTQR